MKIQIFKPTTKIRLRLASANEVEKALDSQKHDKSPGPDNITNEVQTK